MNFVGKMKNLNSGPRAPPKRTEFRWPPGEFEEEEGDMYEAPPFEHQALKVQPRQEEEEDVYLDDREGDMYETPPFERQALKVQQREEEEDVYLDKPTSPAVQQRRAVPPARLGSPLKPPQHADGLSYQPNTKKPPEIDRTEKPGRNKLMPVPAPVFESSTDEDVYLDPNEEQGDDDDLYLEPAEAPHGLKMMMAPCPRTMLLPSSIPTMKPPVPRAKSSAILLAKPDPSPEVRRPPPPALSVKPPCPANLKEGKLSTAIPPPLASKSVCKLLSALFTGSRGTEQSDNENKEWFAGDCNRKTAEELLQCVNKDGAFLIRHSSAQPYTLAVLYQQKVYNIPIRFLEHTKGYALGKEGKKNEETFPTLDEMISHHRNNPLLLIDSKSQAKHTTYLTHPTRP